MTAHRVVFASIELARTVEGSGVRLLTRSARRCGGLVLELDGGAAIFAGTDSPLTKVCGIGLEGPVDLDALARVERAFAERNAPVMVELSTLAAAGVAEQLSRRGYVLVGFEDVLGRSLEVPLPDAEVPPGITIRRSDEDELDTWVAVTVQGFAQPDEEGVQSHESFSTDSLRRVIGQTAADYDRYLGHRDGVVAASASMAIIDGVAWMNGSATLPDHRRRGIQSALYRQRLFDARDRGARLATVTVSGGSRSKRNAERLGFGLWYSRAILQGPG